MLKIVPRSLAKPKLNVFKPKTTIRPSVMFSFGAPKFTVSTHFLNACNPITLQQRNIVVSTATRPRPLKLNTSDTVGDLVGRLKTAGNSGKDVVLVPKSNLNMRILDLLYHEGYIGSFKEVDRFALEVSLKYSNGKTVFDSLTRYSCPSLRKFMGWRDIQKKFGWGLFTAVTTSRGVVSGAQCIADRVGGEVLFHMEK